MMIMIDNNKNIDKNNCSNRLVVSISVIGHFEESNEDLCSQMCLRHGMKQVNFHIVVI